MHKICSCLLLYPYIPWSLSFSSQTAKFWNNLPHEALNTTDLTKFKPLLMYNALFVLAMLLCVILF